MPNHFVRSKVIAEVFISFLSNNEQQQKNVHSLVIPAIKTGSNEIMWNWYKCMPSNVPPYGTINTIHISDWLYEWILNHFMNLIVKYNFDFGLEYWHEFLQNDIAWKRRWSIFFFAMLDFCAILYDLSHYQF